MKMLSVSSCALLIATFACSLCVAQSASLPTVFKGRWVGDRASNTLSLRIEDLESDGRFKGTLAYYGAVCSTDGTPVTGDLSAGALTFKVSLGVRCGEWTFQLSESKAHAFEGVILGTFAPKPLNVFLDR